MWATMVIPTCAVVHPSDSEHKISSIVSFFHNDGILMEFIVHLVGSHNSKTDDLTKTVGIILLQTFVSNLSAHNNGFTNPCRLGLFKNSVILKEQKARQCLCGNYRKKPLTSL